MKQPEHTYFTKIITALFALGVVCQAAGFESAGLRAVLHVRLDLLLPIGSYNTNTCTSSLCTRGLRKAQPNVPRNQLCNTRREIKSRQIPAQTSRQVMTRIEQTCSVIARPNEGGGLCKKRGPCRLPGLTAETNNHYLHLFISQSPFTHRVH